MDEKTGGINFVVQYKRTEIVNANTSRLWGHRLFTSPFVQFNTVILGKFNLLQIDPKAIPVSRPDPKLSTVCLRLSGPLASQGRFNDTYIYYN